jgi:hypothetical protein
MLRESLPYPFITRGKLKQRATEGI